jgi:uncharacterized protein (TIGR02145 family)
MMSFGKKPSVERFIILSLFICVLCWSGCKKKQDDTLVQETGTLTDFDGNTYTTVKIGNQWWMAENLKVKHYRNGATIAGVFNINDTTIWNRKGAYTIYDNNNNAPGFLYNGFSILDSNELAPAGWHVPGDNEWKILEQQLGMSQADADKVNWRGSHEGEKLKVEGMGYWYPYNNIWGTNESGFTAKAGGCRMFNGVWSTPYGIQFTGFWWTSTQGSQNELWYRYLDYKNANIFRYHGLKTYGFSVRCVKDQ